jgi:hypothetical protein
MLVERTNKCCVSALVYVIEGCSWEGREDKMRTRRQEGHGQEKWCIHMCLGGQWWGLKVNGFKGSLIGVVDERCMLQKRTKGQKCMVRNINAFAHVQEVGHVDHKWV